MSRASLFVPLGLFLVIIGFGYAGFALNDPHQLPSALLGKPFPEFSAPRLADVAADGSSEAALVGREVLLGQPVLVNVWATWCPTCLSEHSELIRINRDYGVRIVGLNYKDDAQKAKAWLAQYGDPYALNLFDADGAIGVELGVYGAPETFLLDGQGKIVYKRVGDVNPRIWRDEIQPLLQQLEAIDPAVGS